jgi:23S rRNA (adenine2030-N6)-methyltransferase
MLSYRHAFHAGNHADVLKHFVVGELLGYLTRKDKPFWYIDTHAGAGLYALDSGYAAKNREFESGIGRLWQRRDLPPALDVYVEQVRRLNPGGALRLYPGSPYLAWLMARDIDRLRLFEMHSTEIGVLQDNFGNAGRRAILYDGDGFEGLKGLLPPAPRRALTLIDPSYEDKRDYSRTLSTLQEALRRFATGVYAVWYPVVARPEAQRFAAELKRSVGRTDWLHVALNVSAPPKDGYGLYGSGMFIANPPFQLPGVLKQTLPYLVSVLGQDGHAAFTLEHRIA